MPEIVDLYAMVNRRKHLESDEFGSQKREKFSCIAAQGQRSDSSIDFAPMADPEHQDKRFGIHNPRDNAVVPNPVSPKFAETIALQCLTDRTRIVERSEAVAKEAKNAARGLGINFGQFARRSPLELNLPRHDGAAGRSTESSRCVLRADR